MVDLVTTPFETSYPDVGRLVEDITCAALIVDETARIQWANASLGRIFNTQPENLHGMPVGLALDLGGLNRLLEISALSSRARICEMLPYGARRLKVEVLTLGGLFRHLQRVVIVEDVTDLIDLADEVDRAAGRVETVLTSLGAVVWEMDTAEGGLLSISGPVEDVLGYTAVEIMDRQPVWHQFIHEKDQDRFMSLCRNAAAGNQWELEHRLLRLNGAPIWVRTHCRCEQQIDGRLRTFGLSVDVSELTLAKKQKRRAVYQAETMSVVGRLAGGLAHDFNNMLTVIATTLECALAQSDQPHVCETINRALNAARTGGDLNRQLLSLAVTSEQAPQRVALNGHLPKLASLLRHSLDRSIVIETDTGEGLPFVELVVSEFDSAILNLCLNAQDAMPNGGILSISARRLPPGIDDGSEREIEVAVQDSGTGIPPHKIAKIRDPFYSTKPNGTGLGLYMVKRFAESSGGRLDITSQVGRGTRVSIFLPIANVASTALPAVGGEVVLYIVDDFDLLREGGRILEALGYAVLAARDPEEAMPLINRAEADCVLVSLGGRQDLPGAQFLASVIRQGSPTIPIAYACLDPEPIGPAELPVIYLGELADRSQLAGAISELISRAGH